MHHLPKMPSGFVIKFDGTELKAIPAEQLTFSKLEVPVDCCSFCNVKGLHFSSHSGNEGWETHEWKVCYEQRCKYAMTICLDWLKAGGINDSQSLRNDALRMADKRIEAANRRY